MSDAKSMLFADLIGGSYLWGGIPADVFVTQQTTQQARRDKTDPGISTYDYSRMTSCRPGSTAGSGLGGPEA